MSLKILGIPAASQIGAQHLSTVEAELQDAAKQRALCFQFYTVSTSMTFIGLALGLHAERHCSGTARRGTAKLMSVASAPNCSVGHLL